jgi:hypothetical protein
VDSAKVARSVFAGSFATLVWRRGASELKKLLHYYTKGAGALITPALYAAEDSFDRSPRVWRLRLAGSRGGLVDLGVAGEDVLHVLVGRQRDRGVARRGDRTLASVLQALVEGLGIARVARQNPR